LTPERLSDYLEAQKRLLDRAVPLTRAGGRIVYAVCSLLTGEGALQVASFCQRHPGWRCTMQRRLTPLGDNTDGFFVAILEQSGAQSFASATL
jgi:16S rRNA (cytosine967-C5)-methyltransferase